MIDAEDATYLEVVEKAPFDPIGWLYGSIYAELGQRGLVKRAGLGGYLISEEGQRQLDAFRTQHINAIEQ
jgi:ribosomal protein S19E (S16A)